MNNKSSNTTVWIVVGLVAGLICLICVAGIGVAVWGANQAIETYETEVVEIDDWDFDLDATEEPRPTRRPRPTQDPNQTPDPNNVSTVNTETLETLQNAVVPNADPREMAARMLGIDDIPETIPAPEQFYQVGDERAFSVTNTDTNENFEVDATLQYVTEHVYFWIEDGVSFNEDDLAQLCETFEAEIYPTNREFFGSEWTPGVDNDPHLYILMAGDLGFNLAGYYSSADEVPVEAHEFSNQAEMFVLNADNIQLDDEFTYSVLAHEFQHMIHWYTDANESSWLNEGFSVLAELLNGYDIGGFDYSYISDTDLQLNDWPNDPGATTPHYGSGFLFTNYLLNRFGEETTKDVVAAENNDLSSIDEVLMNEGITDPVTGEPIDADDVFADWAVTNYLLDENVGDGRYIYNNYPQAPQASDTEVVSDCPTEIDSDVRQYGVDYIRIDCEGSYTLNFTGEVEVGVLEENAYSGSYAFWSNKGDESDMTLTQTFDFTGVDGPLTLSYMTWYDLEADYDYLYLLAQVDGGDWQILQTPSSTDEDPSGNSFGWGYNATSGGWIQEEVDLSEFAGQQVTLRFEYVTDAAVNGEGFLLDDISIPEIGYSSDFETDEGGWEAAGWVRMVNSLPQTYKVSLISVGDETTVETIELDANQTASVPVEIGGDVDHVVLVVSGTTRFTRQPALYLVNIE